MSMFFKSLLYAAVAGGLCASVVGKAYEKHIRYLVALLCTAIIVSPLLSLVPSFELSKPSLGADASVDSRAAAALVARQGAEDGERAVAEYIFSQTGIKPREVSIQIKSKGEELTIEGLTVWVSTDSEAETVRGCLDKLFGNALDAEVITDD